LDFIEVRLGEDVVDRTAETRVELNPTREGGGVPLAPCQGPLLLVERGTLGDWIDAAEVVAGAVLQRESDSENRAATHQVRQLDREAQAVGSWVERISDGRRHVGRFHSELDRPSLRATSSAERLDLDLGDRSLSLPDHLHLPRVRGAEDTTSEDVGPSYDNHG
jgi:hypothetical protein